ncbi:hypothetical protein KQX54_002127 [Cotesia glomerata]|uniref:Uncharacterized protein n=1 Tax=Cotesia glomerata TaxID=32391 RepID=A0AAV7I870_COTGL|nr:hypothetical protein KQX54_002127 [Cotesia glomerata]
MIVAKRDLAAQSSRSQQTPGLRRSAPTDRLLQPGLSFRQAFMGGKAVQQAPPLNQPNTNFLEPLAWVVELQRSVSGLAQDIRAINTRMNNLEYESKRIDYIFEFLNINNGAY